MPAVSISDASAVLSLLLERGLVAPLVRTSDGFVTDAHLGQEILALLHARDGRVDLLALADELGVELTQVERKTSELAAASSELRVVTGELYSDVYLQDRAADAQQLLAESGLLAVGEVAAEFDLSLDLVGEVLASLPPGQVVSDELDRSILYYAPFIESTKERLRELCEALEEPTSIKTLLESESLPDTRLMSGLVSALVHDGRIAGKIRGGVFLPRAHVEEKGASFISELQRVGYSEVGEIKTLLDTSSTQAFADFVAEKLSSDLPFAICDELVVLDSFCLDALVKVNEALKESNVVDLRDFLPAEFTESIIRKHILPAFRSNKQVKLVDSYDVDTFLVCAKFLEVDVPRQPWFTDYVPTAAKKAKDDRDSKRNTTRNAIQDEFKSLTALHLDKDLPESVVEYITDHLCTIFKKNVEDAISHSLFKVTDTFLALPVESYSAVLSRRISELWNLLRLNMRGIGTLDEATRSACHVQIVANQYATLVKLSCVHVHISLKGSVDGVLGEYRGSSAEELCSYLESETVGKLEQLAQEAATLQETLASLPAGNSDIAAAFFNVVKDMEAFSSLAKGDDNSLFDAAQRNLINQIHASVAKKGDPASFLHLAVVATYHKVCASRQEPALITFVSGKHVPALVKLLKAHSAEHHESALLGTIVSDFADFQKGVIRWIKSGRASAAVSELESAKQALASRVADCIKRK